MPDYAINTGLPQLPAGLPDKEEQLVRPVYIALNNLAQKVSETTGLVEFSQAELASRGQLNSLLTQNHAKIYALNDTGVALAFGKIVTLYLSSGKIAAQYADATNNTKPAHGIVNAPFGIAPGEYGEIMTVEGYSAGIGGTALGQYYYLSTNGDVQAARPGAAGSIVQAVGFGLGSLGFYQHISSYFHQN